MQALITLADVQGPHPADLAVAWHEALAMVDDLVLHAFECVDESTSWFSAPQVHIDFTWEAMTFNVHHTVDVVVSVSFQTEQSRGHLSYLAYGPHQKHPAEYLRMLLTEASFVTSIKRVRRAP